MADHPLSNYLDIGVAGEDLVAQWLQSQQWLILHQRWRCRLGEIDIIAEYNLGKEDNHPIIAFVEVKTRSSGNWDAGGRSAIALKKQKKLWRTAQIFLTHYPQKADYPCRFDVAIVYGQRVSQQLPATYINQEALAFSSAAGYRLTLEEYIPAAFDCSNFDSY
jgi:putative endonuclease